MFVSCLHAELHAFGLQTRLSIFLSCLPSLANTTPPYLNFLTCCCVLLLTCSVHWLGFLKRHNTSVFLVLIFIPTWSHATESRSSACWRPSSQDASSWPIPVVLNRGYTYHLGDTRSPSRGYEAPKSSGIGPLANTKKKNLRNDVESGCGWVY